MEEKERIKILLARLSLDGHDRGIITIANHCKEAGMEVVYTHFHDPKEIAKVAEEEDVDIIGITSSMGEHFYIASHLMGTLKEKKLEVPVVMGGVIAHVDVPKLEALGVKKVFGPGASPQEAVNYLTDLAS